MAEKKSYFNVDRWLTNEEWEELKLWRKENPTLRWKQSDLHPLNPDLIFNNYDRQRKNGEAWITVERQKEIREKEYKRRREWTAANPEKVKERTKKYNSQNVEERRAKGRERWKNRTEEQKEKKRVTVRAYRNKRYREDPVFRMSLLMRGSINDLFGTLNIRKGNRTEEILGLTFDKFKEHIESLFEPWMNWDNQGDKNVTAADIGKKWDLEHRIPLSSAKTEEDILKLCHYSNIRPMCSYTNRYIKGHKLDWQNG